ncbi:MAG: tetratricopeptide repeat protein [Caldilineaceae bacterium]
MAKGRNQDETIIHIANDADDFGALFRTYLVHRTENLLAEVSKDDSLLDEEVRSKALAALEFALESSELQSLAGGLLLAMAPKMERAGFRDEWVPLLKRGVELEFAVKDRVIKAELLYQLGFLCQLRGHYVEAEGYLLRSINEFACLQLFSRQAAVHFRLAYVNRLQRNYGQVRQQIEQGFALVDDQDPACAHGYYLRGLLAYDDNDYVTAIEAYQHSLQLYEIAGDLRMVALRLGNIGLAFSEWKKFEEAVRYYHRSIEIFEALQDTAQMAMMKMNLGNIYLLQNEPDAAIALYDMVEPIFRKNSDELHLALLYLNYGIAFRLAKQWQKAEQYLLSAIERWQQFNDIHSLINTLDELGIMYRERGDFSQAKKTFEQAFRLLLQIEHQPGFQRLSERITAHRNQLEVQFVER